MWGPLLLALLLDAPAHASRADVRRQVGQLGIAADTRHAYPGGVIAVRLRSRRGVGYTLAVLEGRRFPFLGSPEGPRALVPVPIGTAAGPTILGIEIRGTRGRQRIAVPVTIAPRTYPVRTLELPVEKRPLLAGPEALTDGRRLLRLLRTISPVQQWTGRFAAPVEAAAQATFGVSETWVGGAALASFSDSVHGDYHRGVDYAVLPGTTVRAPAGGTVLFAGPLALTGRTVVLDHGHGVVSVLAHLSRTDVHTGDRLEAGRAVGLSGDSGAAATPHLHWAVYVAALPVDPFALSGLF